MVESIQKMSNSRRERLVSNVAVQFSHFIADTKPQCPSNPSLRIIGPYCPFRTTLQSLLHGTILVLKRMRQANFGPSKMVPYFREEEVCRLKNDCRVNAAKGVVPIPMQTNPKEIKGNDDCGIPVRKALVRQ
jgi:hypothetical protein